MFNSLHIGYMVVSGIITLALLILLNRLAKTEQSKFLCIRFFALATVLLHYSSLWVDYFTTGSAVVEPPMLLPLYPCNICMWLLLISSFVKRRENFAYRTLAEFTFWAGCVCGFIGILLNEQFAFNPTLRDYHVLKGLLSHSTMIVGAALLAALGVVKIRVRNVLSVILGLALFITIGASMNALYAHFNLPPCNAMYLLENPIEALPWFSTSLIGLLAVAVSLVLTLLYEQILVPKGERWYNHLKHNKKEHP